jgi:hypothetical protein
MTERNITANFDYVNRKINFNLVGASNSPPYPSYLFRLYDEEGCIIANAYVPEVSATSYGDLYASSIDFGLDLRGFVAAYDSSFGRTDLSGVYVGVPTTNWEMSSELDYSPGLSLIDTLNNKTTNYLTNRQAYETGWLSSPILTIDKRSNKYIGDKLLITRGDAVLQATIATVTNKNALTFTTNNLPPGASYANYNLNSSIVEVLSGAASGTTFAVTSHAAGSSTVYVDRDCFSMSGQLVKIMPYREVIGYTGWNYDTGLPSNKGSGGIMGRFSLNQNIPNKIGSLYYTTGTFVNSIYSGEHLGYIPDVTAPFQLLSLAGDNPGTAYLGFFYFQPTNPYYPAGTGYHITQVLLQNHKIDPYKRDISRGDLVIYNPSSNPASTATGVIVLAGDDGVNTTIQYWPAQTPAAGSTYTIFRSNQVYLQCFPEFDKTYNCAAFPVSGAANFVLTETLPYSKVYAEGAVYSSVRTPAAELDFNANEYEGAFGNTAYTSHFHIGPVRLSNGQVLDDSKTLSTKGVTPFLYFSGAVYNGNPNSPVTVFSRSGFSTQNTNVAGNFDGSYYKDGVMTFTANTVFNASETMVCKAAVSYGSAKIERVFTIPVQPAV